VTHHAVREDAHTLYGFAGERDRELFRHLIRVSGVGPKLALTILSGMDARQLCPRRAGRRPVTRWWPCPASGRKPPSACWWRCATACPPGWMSSAPQTAGRRRRPAARDKLRDAEEALVSLGYKPAEAARLVAAVDSEPSRQRGADPPGAAVDGAPEPACENEQGKGSKA
jgi:Holliday junction DNA helicase RuvA